MKKYNLLALLSLGSFALFAQQTRTLDAVRLNTLPNIDGGLSDSCWQLLSPLDDFTTATPVFGKTPHCRTEVRLFYTETHLYLAAYCYDPDNDGVRNDGGIRDGSRTGDWFQLSLDTWHDGQLAFDFTVTAAGVQADARQLDGNWNASWHSSVAPRADGWTLEMSIPFSALRFAKNKPQHTWGLQLTRYDRSTGETSTWSPQHPLVQDRVWQFGTLAGLRDIRQTKRRSLSLFSATAYHTGVENYAPWYSRSLWETFGIDGRLGMGPNATIDVSLAPPLAVRILGDLPNSADKNIAGNVALPEPRPLVAEESDLFGRGQGVSLNPVVVASDLVWRLRPLASDLRLINYSNSTLRQATKVTIRSKGNWRFGVYNALLGPVQVEIYKNDWHYTRTLQKVSNYNYFSAEYLLRNNSYINFSNAVLWAGPGMNTVLPTLNMRLRDRSNTYEFAGSSRLSIQALDTTRQTGGAIDLAIARVNKRWGWVLRHKGSNTAYQPYLLSPYPGEGPATSARMTYQNYTPTGPFLNIGASAGGSVAYVWFASERNTWLLHADVQALDRHFRQYTLGLSSIPYWQVIRHTNGSIRLNQRVSPFLGGRLGYTSDTRRRFYCRTGLEGGAGIQGEFPQLKAYAAPAWVLNRRLTLEAELKTLGNLQAIMALNEPGRWLFWRRDFWQHSASARLDWYPLKRTQLSVSLNYLKYDFVKQETVELLADGKLHPVNYAEQEIPDAVYQTATLGVQHFFSSVSQIRLRHTFTLGDTRINAITSGGRLERIEGGRTELSVVFVVE